jgi:hypothetical protein
MIIILPLGNATSGEPYLADHAAPASICFHVAPLSVDRQTSFTVFVVLPPARMILPSGMVTRLCAYLGAHPALAFINFHVAP